eukprot:CAMPEP_0198335294 /NCGR_PEP_ID=MMETSP1450-20131203/20224_1 /TAXON_ID=753684 ORGANISM="Madagascaria erythrocladiodes, Strain CCMP3234" /NCGR_SAMPLE_ID=MMETSP1450 /ASSEMBLY_ACC=CAM_ASM_001115 /LENGTH=73 /DNA_ID=CAMNT_0044039951 /DNA_START=15 /DNA_END=236 /DNA_ORIENTATION=-
MHQRASSNSGIGGARRQRHQRVKLVDEHYACTYLAQRRGHALHGGARRRRVLVGGVALLRSSGEQRRTHNIVT